MNMDIDKIMLASAIIIAVVAVMCVPTIFTP